MKLRSGRIKETKKIPLKGFHVKGRASAPVPDNVLVTDNTRKLSLGREYGVITRNQAVGLRDMYSIAEECRWTPRLATCC